MADAMGRAGRRVWPWLGLVGALWALWGCEPELTEPLFREQVFADLDAGGMDDAVVGPVSEDLTGTWALVGDWSTCVTVFGTDELRTRYIHRVKIVQEGVHLHETHTVCAAVNTPLLGLETVVSDAILAAASPLEVESVVIGTPGRLGYDGGVQVQLWGIRLDDPLDERMPLASELPDARIYDSDEDGHDGATLSIGGDACEVYIVQRSISSVHGTLQPDGTIVGSGYMATEQTVLDASNAFCASPYATVSNDAWSFTRLVRVDEDGMDLDTDGDGEVDCAEILAARTSLGTFLEPDRTRCEDP